MMFHQRFAPLFVCAVLQTISIFNPLFAQPSDAPAPLLNVRDFGAKGDGHTDDTQAFVQALRAQNESRGSGQSIVLFQSQRTLYVPAGHYRISAALEAGAYLSLFGERAIIEQTNAASDILKTQGYRAEISGVIFVGGRRAIVINTGNVDSSSIRITNCEFHRTAGSAIETEEPSNSSLLLVRDCIFIDCDQVLISRTDGATVQDCWVTTRREMKNKAVFENHGVLRLERMLGVPVVQPENDQRWIDNYNVVSCRSVRFGGEFAGFCAVNNLAPYQYKYPLWPTGVTLEDCEIYALGNPAKKSAIFCEQVPNQIVVRGCRGLIDLPIVKIDEKLNLSTYFNNATDPDMIKIHLEDSNTHVQPHHKRLPEPMRKWATKPPRP